MKIEMKTLILCLTAYAVLSFGTASAGPIVSKITPSVPGVVYVKFKTNAPHLASALAGVVSVKSDPSQYDGVVRSLGANRVSPFDPAALHDSIANASGVARIFVINYSNEITPIEAVNMFLGCGEIEAASPRYLFPITSVPNDPQIPNQYALAKMNVFGAWDVTTGDTSIVIADVDVGANYNHEDLARAVKFNIGEVGTDSHGKDKRTNGIDDDGDSVIDNWRGVNIVGSGTPQLFHPTGDPIPGSTASGSNHGTITAGLIAATGNNNLGIAGTGYGCKLMIVRADDGAGNISGGYEGIHYALVHGARIVNCSWGGPIDLKSFGILETIVTEATMHKALIVAAVGNNTQNVDSILFAPAVLTGVLAVGATDESDQPAGFSNFGHRVDVYAPGANVLSTDWPGNDKYTSESGTSFASPQVAGIVGLLMSKHPDWPVKALSQQIINTCENVVRPSNRFQYWGRVNAAAALGTPTLPGLAINSYTINGSNKGIIDTIGTATSLSVVFKNLVGNGQNLSVNLLTVGGVSIDQAQQQIGGMNTGEIHQLNFTLHRTGQFSTGSLPLFFAVSDGATYKDTLVLVVPMRSQQGFIYVDSSYGYCTSVKQVTPAIAWVAHGFDDGLQVFSYFETESGDSWSPPQVTVDQLSAPWCVEALDDQAAWFGSASSNGKTHARVILTPDAGSSWQVVDVATITPYVNSIHFSTPTNGMFVGDPRNGNWGIGVTTDGGTTWKASTSTSSALSGELGWKNSISWVRKNGWFGTNKGEVYKTSDGGLHWTAHQLSSSNVVGVGFDDDSLHGFAVCKPAVKALTGTINGTTGLFRSSDGGVTWSSINLPSANTIPSDVKFVPGLDLAFLVTNTGLYRSTDFGSSWTAAGVPETWSGADGTISIASDTKKYAATTVSGSGTISLSGPMPPKQSVEYPVLGGSIELLQSSPNPTSARTTIAFVTLQTEHVTLSIFDALGRRVEMLMDENVDAGKHSVSFTASHLVTGVYQYVLETRSGVRMSRRLTVVK